MFKIFCIGNLTADPRTGEHNGKSVTNLKVAMRTVFKDANNEYITNFADVSVWNNQAQSCARLKKGNKVGIVGSAVVKPYVDANGKSGFNIVISPDNVEFVTPLPKEGADIFG